YTVFSRYCVSDLFSSDLNQADDFPRPGRINWVTVGSGLTLAWNVRFGKGAADRALWQRPLDRVNWLNLYARYDPVSQGPAPAGKHGRGSGGEHRWKRGTS